MSITKGPADETFMRRALRLAKRGAGCVSPNPMVGAVIVRDGRIVGEGFHRCCGGNHAEIEAIRNASEAVSGATFYITLEPCSHHGRTPPCSDALIAARPGCVVVGTADPNPLVSGRGIGALRAAGIETRVGVLEEACRELNDAFFKYIRTGIPLVTLKFAQTLDGRIATASGHSRWISSPASRRFAHRLRSHHDAILVGAETVLRDDPQLTCRLVRGKSPLRVVLDSRLRVRPDACIFSADLPGRTIVAATARAPEERRRLFAKRGVEVWTIGEDPQGRVDLKELLAALGKEELSSLLVEGGAAVITAFLRERLADRLIAVVAPRIAGRGIETVGDLGVLNMDDALRLRFRRIARRGDDLILEARFPSPETPEAAPPPGCRPGRN